MAVISLAFGQYVLEPLFMPCHIPPMAVKLATAIGISEYTQTHSKQATLKSHSSFNLLCFFYELVFFQFAGLLVSV